MKTPVTPSTNNPPLHRALLTALSLLPFASQLLASGNTFNIQSYGATGSGTNDAANAIRHAVLDAVADGGGTILIPSGTYVLSSPVGYYDSFIIPHDDVNFLGEGDASVLKVADGMNAACQFGWYVFGPCNPGESVSRAKFSNFKVDCNGTNNLESSGTIKHKDPVLWIASGSNLTIENLSIVNNGGRQCITLSSTDSTLTIQNAVIQNCRFDTVGKAVQDNVYQNDHSAIYLRGDGCSVLYNTLTNPVQDNASTALEIHSSNSLIRGNVIKNFSTGINIVATTISQTNTTYDYNFIYGVNRAIAYHTSAGYFFQNVNVTNNSFLGGGVIYPLVDADSNIATSFGDSCIRGNIFTCISATATGTDHAAGLRAGLGATLVIQDNVFQNLRGRAVELGAGLPTSLTIENNNIVDCCQTINTSYQRAIELNNTGTIPALSVRFNLIRNTGTTQWIDGGIHGNVDLGSAVFEKNTFSNLRSYEIKWENTRNSVTVAIGSLSIKHIGYTSPLNTVRASVGSTWVNMTDGYVWSKLSGSTSASGWQQSAQPIY